MDNDNFMDVKVGDFVQIFDKEVRVEVIGAKTFMAGGWFFDKEDGALHGTTGQERIVVCFRTPRVIVEKYPRGAA